MGPEVSDHRTMMARHKRIHQASEAVSEAQICGWDRHGGPSGKGRESCWHPCKMQQSPSVKRQGYHKQGQLDALRCRPLRAFGGFILVFSLPGTSVQSEQCELQRTVTTRNSASPPTPGCTLEFPSPRVPSPTN